MRNNNLIAIAMTEAASALEGLSSGASKVDKLKAAMKVTKDHWLCTNEDEQFEAAVSAVMHVEGLESDFAKQILEECTNIGKLNAFFRAAQAGLEVMPPEISAEYETLGLMRLWNEVG